MLDDAELPIMSFGFFGLFGSRGQGKTYQALKIMSAY